MAVKILKSSIDKGNAPAKTSTAESSKSLTPVEASGLGDCRHFVKEKTRMDGGSGATRRNGQQAVKCKTHTFECDCTWISFVRNLSVN